MPGNFQTFSQTVNSYGSDMLMGQFLSTVQAKRIKDNKAQVEEAIAFQQKSEPSTLTVFTAISRYPNVRRQQKLGDNLHNGLVSNVGSYMRYKVQLDGIEISNKSPVRQAVNNNSILNTLKRLFQ